MREKILLYNFQDKLRLAQARKAFASLPAELVLVKKEDYLKPAGYLAGVKGILPLGGTYEGEELDGEMILFAGLTEQVLDKALTALRKNGLAGIACKAVLTQTNQYWNALQIYEELKREHAAYNGGEGSAAD